MKPARLLFALVMAAALTSRAQAEVGDATLRTDHPQYAGEGAFQTIEDCVAFAAGQQKSPQERAIAMYLWLLTHQWHLHSPQECNVPGETPDSKRDNRYDMIVYDANRARFSYGYGLCGTVHAWNEPYWKALGMNARRRAFPGHTNSEIEYDGSWHAFDTDMAGLIFRKDGIVAGYEDVVKDPSCANRAKAPIPCYPFAWPGDFNGMKSGWAEIAKGGKWYKMYNSGYAAHPGVVHLRSGESFTRYLDRDRFGGPSKRRFWHNMPGGPARDWTFAGQGEPRQEGEKSNSRGNASYANGEFVYAPDLSGEKYREGIVEQTSNVRGRGQSPKLHTPDGKPASVTFSHFSPYVICGDPADDANPMSGPATGGLVIAGTTVGEVRLEISTDQGQSWTAVGELKGDFEKDVTDVVKGHYGWQARFLWQQTAGLDAVKFTTVTQVCQTIYPRLKPGGSQVVYRAASRAVVPVLPNFGLKEEELGRLEDKSLRTNLAYSARSKQQQVAYKTQNNKPASVVFKIESPEPLVEVTAAARYGIRVPPPDKTDFHLDVSTDGGKTWELMGKAEPPADNEYSSGWMYGRADIAKPGVKSALVRATVYAGGYQTGVIEAQLYGLRKTAEPQGAKITYGWKEGGVAKSHVENVPAGAKEHPFKVPTGAAIVDDFVRIETP